MNRDIDECMVTDYSEAFIEWHEKEGYAIFPTKDQAFRLWIAAMEEFKCNPPEGLYRIWDDVLVCGKPGKIIGKGDDGTMTGNPAKVCRKPAWMPKENEPVFVEVNGKATIGVWGTGYVHVGSDPGLRFSEVKPYNPTKIGHPWNEV